MDQFEEVGRALLYALAQGRPEPKRKDQPCSVCGDLMPAAFRSKRRTIMQIGSRLIDYDALQQAAKPDGECYECYLLLQAIKSLPLPPDVQISGLEVCGEHTILEKKMLGKIATDIRQDTLYINISLGEGTKPETLEFYSVPGYPTPFPGILPRTRISPNTGSEEAVQWAKKHLDTCLSDHKLCHKPPKPPREEPVADVLSDFFSHGTHEKIPPGFAEAYNEIMRGLPKEPQLEDGNSLETELPTRVLDLSSFSQGVVKLVETGGMRGTYACLSHCWGPTQFITTTPANLAAHLHKLPFSALSQTFKDAITFTSALGIRYLWIDSLCIIQGDIEDWEKESAKMCSVYQNAIVTLAASAASDGSAGLFTNTRTSKQDLIVFRDPDEDRKEPSWAIHVRRRLWHPGFRFPAGEEIKNIPLLDRGWVYQERLLSSRFLHFGPDELIWECGEQTACECSNFYRCADLERPKITHNKVMNQPSPPMDLLHRWHSIVKEYSNLKLTKPSDKLPALAGVAWQMSNLRRGGYLAGLWEQTLVQDMLWFCQPHECELAPKPATWRAPSWSWAAVDTSVHYDNCGHIKKQSWDAPEPRIAPFEVWCWPKSEASPFGEVSEGGMTLIGGVTPVRLMKKMVEDGASGQQKKVKYGVRMKSHSGMLEFHPDWRWPEDGWHWILPSWDPSMDGSYFERRDEDLYILPVAQIGDMVYFLGLKFQKAVGTTVRVYERVGLGLAEATVLPPSAVQGGIISIS